MRFEVTRRPVVGGRQLSELFAEGGEHCCGVSIGALSLRSSGEQ
jgi:hypothetical protein